MAQRKAPRCPKKAREEGWLICYADECSISMMPNLSHTFAPRGQRPVIVTSTEVSVRVYVASAISSRGDLVWDTQNRPFTSADIINFLKKVNRSLRQPIMVIWDNASIHNSEEVRNFLKVAAQGSLHLVQQPKYSPHLNADEQVWSYLKRVELANNCKKNIKELLPQIEKGLRNMATKPQLIRQFFAHPELGFHN